MLPLPSELRIFAHRGAIDHGLGVAVGAAAAANHVFTFNTLFAALPAPPNRRYLQPAGSMLLLRELLLATEGPLGALAHDPPSVRAIQSALAELRAAGVAADALLGGKLSPELRSLAELLRSYERALDQWGLFDDADRERYAVLSIAKGGLPAWLAHTKSIRVEGGANLFGSRLDLLRAFAASGREVRVRLPYDNQRRYAFAWPEASLHRLEASGDNRIVVEYDSRVGEGPLAPLRGAQFAGRIVPAAPVRLLQADSFGDHAQAAVAQVALWLREHEVPAHRIAVAVANPALEARVQRELAEAGLPLRFLRGPTLTGSTAMRVLCLALELPLLAYPRESVVELVLALGLSVKLDDRTLLSSERVAAELRKAGVRSQRVGGYRAALLRYARRSTRNTQAAVHQAECIADALETLFAALETVPSASDLPALLETTRALWQRLALAPARFSFTDPVQLKVDAPLLSAGAEEVEATRQVESLLKELREAARAAPSLGCNFSRRELVDLLRVLAARVRLSQRGAAPGGVALISPAELVEASYARVLLVGVDADVFPRPMRPEPILTEALRAEINRLLGPRLLQYAPLSGRAALRAEARDLWLWLEALASCDEELVVTYTRPQDGGERGKSELIEELARSLGCPVEPISPGYAAPRAYSMPQARGIWAHGRFHRTTRLYQAPPLNRVLALEHALGAGGAVELLRLGHRVKREAALLDPAHEQGRLPEHQRQRLAAHYFDKVLSASQLDTLAMCGFRHFAANLLRLAREDVATLGPDPREEGSAAHAALQVVYADIIANGGLAVARADPDAAVRRAREIFDIHEEQILREVVVHPLLRAATLEAAWLVVVRQLEQDLQPTNTFEPVALEYRFDDRAGANAPSLMLRSSTTQKALQVRGGIDRVDCGDGMVLALDYKRSAQERTSGRHLQLPLYLAVALRDFGAGQSAVGAAWVKLRDAARKEAVAFGMAPDAFLDELAQSLWLRIERMLSGNTAPDPEPVDLCNRCDFKALCRYRPSAFVDQEEA